jgi:AcrR family transcriptional regulator
MASSVKPRRQYDSSRRREQARRHRERVIASARALFLSQGYAATTVAMIAADADVSVEMIYKAFGNKPGLVKAVFDVDVAGDSEPIPVVERPWVAAIRAEPDPRRKLELWADHVADVLPRIAPILVLVRTAAATDPDLAATHRTLLDERLTGMGLFARHLHEGGSLRTGVTVDEARDILWTYISDELYELLVLERGWSIDRYRDHVASAVTVALVGD